MSKFKVGDKLKQINTGNNNTGLFSVITILKVSGKQYTSTESNFGCILWTEDYLEDNFELVEEEKCEGIRVNYLSNSFEIPQSYIYQEIKKAEIENKYYLTLGSIYGYKVYLSKKEIYNYQEIKPFGMYKVGVDFGFEEKPFNLQEVINKINKNYMSKITNFAKNLTLSADEKLLRKYSLKNECGEFTDEAESLVIAKLVKENESYLIELAKGMEAEEAKK